MEQSKLEALLAKDVNVIVRILEKFNEKNAETFDFKNFQTGDQWYKLWKAVFAILSDTTLQPAHHLGLNTIRILTRDRESLSRHDIGDNISTLLAFAQLTPNEISTSFDDANAIIVVDALKCLCNLAYQSADCRFKCIKKNALDSILKRVISPIQYPTVVELFDMKLLFLLTAFDAEYLTTVLMDLNAVPYLTEWLHEKLNDVTNRAYIDEEMDVMAEMLKAMFNITKTPDKSPHENEIENLHLTGVLRDVLYRFGDLNTVKEIEVVSHVINMLNNIATSSLIELLVKLDSSQASSSGKNEKVIPFEERNVRALDIILRFLKYVLENKENSVKAFLLADPALAVLTKCARGHPIMRHYIRSVVLPPLRDVLIRPEEGNELRNYLCRLMTGPSENLVTLSTDLLFTLCKENVRRMIKYTGYGNAAGFFARRGLLDFRPVESAQYSSDSENSDTEEYKEKAAGINPVVGCFEAPKKNPLEGMTEEQKEHEAMQLVGLIDQLQKTGIIQTCRIGEDGKPVPIEHIQQLQVELPKQQADKNEKS